MTDLFPGFSSLAIGGTGAEIFLRSAGEGPALLLLHGFPQSHAMWHKIAPQLAEQFTVVVPDLRGYGRSGVPQNDADNVAYSKRAMGRDMVEVMRSLGHETFMVIGHDRGGRVAYRLTLDHAERVVRLALLDIVTTLDMWELYDAQFAMGGYHWLFLAQPSPMPETLISAAPDYYLDWTLTSWTASGDLSAFAAGALEDYRSAFRQPDRIAAMCNDYRAGWTFDRAADQADRVAGRKIACPVHVLWGQHGIPGKGETGPLELWQPWCDTVTGTPVNCGHFLAEEAPDDTMRHLVPFLRGD